MGVLELGINSRGPDGATAGSRPEGYPGVDSLAGDIGMDEISQSRPYVWQPPGNQRRISLELDVVDRILQESLRGLGAAPKRGAEIGGLLLGSISEDGTLHITGSLPAECSHSQGSSFTLNNDEYHRFSAMVARFEPDQGRPAEAIGFYRSHTREAAAGANSLSLSMDDVRIFDALFGGAWPVILLVRPSVSRAAIGGFFFREDGGVRREASYLEFPFRRKELVGGNEGDAESNDENDDVVDLASQAGQPDPLPKPRLEQPSVDPRPAHQARAQRAMAAVITPAAAGDRPRRGPSTSAQAGTSLLSGGAESQQRPKQSRRWSLLPLSFLFLILGLLLGIQSALTFAPTFLAKSFSIALRVRPLNSEARRVQLDWRSSSPAISLAQDATLYIEDGGVPKVVVLTREQLLSGTVVYPPVNQYVRFRLDVRLRDNAVFSESVDYRRP